MAATTLEANNAMPLRPRGRDRARGSGATPDTRPSGRGPTTADEEPIETTSRNGKNPRKSMPVLQGPIALAVTIAAVIFNLACGASSTPGASPTPTPTPTPVPIDPQETLRRTGQVMEGLETFHFRLFHEKGSMELLPGLVVSEVEGDVVKPDRIFVAFTGSLGSLAIKASLITLGDSGYMTNPLTGEWESGPAGVSSLGFFDPSKGIAAMTSQVGRARLLDPEAERTDAISIAGSLPAKALGPLVGETLEDTTVNVVLTIDVDRHHLIEVRIEGRVMPKDAEEVVRVIVLSAFNEPISIEPPI